jgi:thymidylate synthase ThyX
MPNDHLEVFSTNVGDASIHVPVGLHPQDGAMLCALYSRSAAGILQLIEKVKASDSGKFITKWYIGYGDASIGDNGSFYVMLENISMLAAKRFEHWPLFNGLEPSSRFIDMADRGWYLPEQINTEENRAWMLALRNDYVKYTRGLQETLQERIARPGEVTQEVYDATLRALAYDITRGILPAGTKTHVALHMTFRQFNDFLPWLLTDQLPEVRELAAAVHKHLRCVYPEVFAREFTEEQLSWARTVQRATTYVDVPFSYVQPRIDIKHYGNLAKSFTMLSKIRPKGITYPLALTMSTVVHATGMLDFGSYRDLQRHRFMLPQVPLLTTKFGPHPFYVEGLPHKGLYQAAAEFVSKVAEASSPLLAQYCTPLAFQVPVDAVYPIGGFVHLMELRSKHDTHPTLRKLTHDWHNAYVCAAAAWDDPITHMNKEPSRVRFRRGQQTITEKKS